MTIRRRIALLVALAGFITNCLFSVIIFWELIEQPLDLLDKDLQKEADRAAYLLISAGQKSAETTLSEKNTAPLWITIYERDSGRMLYRSKMAARISLPALKPGSRKTFRAFVPPESLKDKGETTGHKTAFRIRCFDLSFNGQHYVVQIAFSMEDIEEEIWELIFSLGAGLLLTCIVLIFISQIVADKILEPIGKMKDLALEISEKNLDRRIPAGDAKDEFSDLARTINWMLDRLRDSFIRQQNLLFDTSHELKTPLTTMRLAIEGICSIEDTTLSAFTGEKLAIINQNVLRMERLVKDLLSLSSLESKAGLDTQDVDLTKILNVLIDDYHLIAKERHVRLLVNLPDSMMIKGNREALTRAFSNLLLNTMSREALSM